MEDEATWTSGTGLASAQNAQKLWEAFSSEERGLRCFGRLPQRCGACGEEASVLNASAERPDGPRRMHVDEPRSRWTSVQGARRTLLDWGGLSSALRLAPHGLAASAAPRAPRLLPSGLLLSDPAPTSAWAPGLQLHPEPIWFAFSSPTALKPFKASI